MSSDTDRARIAELNAKVTAIGSKAVAVLDGPGRQQDLSDRALGECPLWPDIRLASVDVRFTPKKGTLLSTTGMSALCQKRTFRQLLVYLPVLLAAAA